MSTGIRRRGRHYALQLLFALDLNDTLSLERAIQECARIFDIPIHAQAGQFATRLVQETLSHREEMDALIQGASRNWRIERMARVDRNILRLAAYELQYCSDVPVKVVINEAVELAKRFGAQEASAFINGVLDRVAKQVRGS